MDKDKKPLSKRAKVGIAVASVAVVCGLGFGGYAVYQNTQNKQAEQTQVQQASIEDIQNDLSSFGIDANNARIESNAGHVMIVVQSDKTADQKIETSARAAAKVAKSTKDKHVKDTQLSDSTALKQAANNAGFSMEEKDGRVQVATPADKTVANKEVDMTSDDNTCTKDVTVVVTDNEGKINVVVSDKTDTNIDADKDETKDVVNNAGGHEIDDNTFNDSTLKDQGVTQVGGDVPQAPDGTPIVIDKNQQPAVVPPAEQPTQPEQNTDNSQSSDQPQQSGDQQQQQPTQTGNNTPAQPQQPAKPSGHYETRTRTVVDKAAWTEQKQVGVDNICTFSNGHVAYNITDAQAIDYGAEHNCSWSWSTKPKYQTINHPAQTHQETYQVWVND